MVSVFVVVNDLPESARLVTALDRSEPVLVRVPRAASYASADGGVRVDVTHAADLSDEDLLSILELGPDVDALPIALVSAEDGITLCVGVDETMTVISALVSPPSPPSAPSAPAVSTSDGHAVKRGRKRTFAPDEAHRSPASTKFGSGMSIDSSKALVEGLIRKLGRKGDTGPNRAEVDVVAFLKGSDPVTMPS